MPSVEELVADCQGFYREDLTSLTIFMNGVRDWFVLNNRLQESSVVHSVKVRVKDPEHLADKVRRKVAGLDLDSLQSRVVYERMTDLAGVRVLLLHQEQFSAIHNEIYRRVASGDWCFFEQPKAYTWDPESEEFFRSLGLETHLKESYYTSVHYVVKPRQDSSLYCEVQVRTLFEEIWGEVDHQLNYPSPTENLACREQLKVLAKVVGAGSRLVDSIFRSANQ